MFPPVAPTEYRIYWENHDKPTLPAGMLMTLTCEVKRSRPKVSFRWFRDGIELTPLAIEETPTYDSAGKYNDISLFSWRCVEIFLNNRGDNKLVLCTLKLYRNMFSTFCDICYMLHWLCIGSLGTGVSSRQIYMVLSMKPVL